MTDEVIDYRRWIKETFPLPVSEGDSLSSSTGSDASTLSAPASDTVNILRINIFIKSFVSLYLYSYFFILVISSFNIDFISRLSLYI